MGRGEGQADVAQLITERGLYQPMQRVLKKLKIIRSAEHVEAGGCFCLHTQAWQVAACWHAHTPTAASLHEQHRRGTLSLVITTTEIAAIVISPPPPRRCATYSINALVGRRVREIREDRLTLQPYTPKT